MSAYGKRTHLPNILHVMDSERPEQYRGVSYLAQVIEPILQIRRYTESELIAAIVESFFTAFVKTDTGADENPINETGGDGGEISRDENEYEMGPGPVSYTHLDVYKRQGSYHGDISYDLAKNLTIKRNYGKMCGF